MKSVLLTAALVAAATAPSFAKTVRIPVTRGAGVDAAADGVQNIF